MRTPPEVKLLSESRQRFSLMKQVHQAARGEASRRKRRSPFLREEAEGRAFFKTSSSSRRTRFFQNKLLPSGTSGASFGKPPEVKLLPFLREARPPPEVKLLPFFREDARPWESASFGRRGLLPFLREARAAREWRPSYSFL